MWDLLLSRIPEAKLVSWYSWLTFFTIVLPIIGGFTGWAAWKVDDKIDDVNEAADKKEDDAFRLQIAELNRVAGIANERAAKLEKDAAEYRDRAAKSELELEIIKERIKPRRISADKRPALIASLAVLPKLPINVSFQHGNLECERLAVDIAEIFVAAKFSDVGVGQSIEATVAAEVMIFHHPKDTQTANTIFAAFTAAGLRAKTFENPELNRISFFISPRVQ